jgi:hypothetical protein
MSSFFSKRTCLAVLLSILSILVFAEWASAQQGIPGSWCVLRRHNVYEPLRCFEFFLCDTTKDVLRCGIAGNGGCGVGEMGRREGWEVDPGAHPTNVPGPYVTWQGADYVMTVLGRFSGDWYGCLGPRKMELPERVPVRDGATEPGFCILRKPIPQWPPNCFEFDLAPAGSGRAVIQGGFCFVTARGARENWTVDPTFGGPFLQRGQAQAAHDRLHRFAGNFYGCPEGSPTPPDGGGTGPNRSKHARFDRPMNGGRRLDPCMYFAKDCGQPVADAFCRNNGYKKSAGFDTEPTPHTTTLTGVTCDNPGSPTTCGGFVYILCE